MPACEGKLLGPATCDRIRPRSKGGTLAPGNKALACGRCNVDKGSRTLRSWLYRLELAGDRPAEIVVRFMSMQGEGREPCRISRRAKASRRS
jgi:hypothetical protein